MRLTLNSGNYKEGKLMNKVYEIITNQILDQLKAGVIPWHKPWANSGEIQNFVSKKAYTGINPFLLNGAGYACPYWVTYKQAKQLKGNVKKGEHGQMIIFFKMSPYKDKETGEDKNLPILRYYNVFNLEQTEGIDWQKPESARDHNPIKTCENIIKGFADKPRIASGPQACYSPSQDRIEIPSPELFINDAEYYSTLFHELSHSTGHINRLNRETLTDSGAYFGSHQYSKEELVAEFSAAMLCGVAGIEQATIDNSAAYIESWSHRLRKDHKLIIQAATKAQRSADYIQGKYKTIEIKAAA